MQRYRTTLQSKSALKEEAYWHHLMPTAQPSVSKHFALTFIIFCLVCQLVAVMTLLWGPFLQDSCTM